MATRLRTHRPEMGQLTLDEDTIHLPEVLDEEVSQSKLKEAASLLEKSYTQADDLEWEESAFAWLRRLAPGRRGKAGCDLIDAWAVQHGIPTAARTAADHDRILAGLRANVKFSTRWADGDFVFQQVKDGDFDLLVFLAVSPGKLDLWLVPKDVALAHVLSSTQEEGWLTFPENLPPAWMAPYGGDLTAAAAYLAALVAKEA